MSGFRKSFILVMAATPLLWAAEKTEYLQGNPALQALCIVLGTIILVFAGVALIAWVFDENSKYHERRQRVEANTPAIILVRELKTLQPDVAKLFLKSPQALLIEMRFAGLDQPIEIVPVATAPDGTQVPLWFMRKFVKASNIGYLQPVGAYHDGDKRRFAQAATDIFINLDWASPAAGPHPAKWRVPYHSVLKAIQGSM